MSLYILRVQGSICCIAGEIAFEVVALLVCGLVCTLGVLLAANWYRRRRSFHRHVQQNIVTQRQRHFERLQQQQQHLQEMERQQQLLENQRRELHSLQQAQLHSDLTCPQLRPLLHSSQHEQTGPGKHRRSRSKTSEPAIPSSPSASSTHSEAIGTQVRSQTQLERLPKPRRSRSAQRSQATNEAAGDTQRGLLRSISDVTAEAADLESGSNLKLSRHSMGTALRAGALPELQGSEASTPGSLAGSASCQTHHSWSNDVAFTSGASDMWRPADGASGSQPTSQPGAKRKSRHSRKAAKKAAPAKRRFIPGLDAEFDPAIHELPQPPQDPSAGHTRSRGSVESVDSSLHSSSLPLSSALAHRQLSVNAPVFVPTGYAQNSVYPLTQQLWQHRIPMRHSIGHAPLGSPHQFFPQSNPGPLSVDSLPHFRPSQTVLQSSPSFGSYIHSSPPARRTSYQDQATQPALAAVQKPSPRFSPTSVLPLHNSVEFSHLPQSSCSTSLQFGAYTAAERLPQLGPVDSARSWSLTQLPEEVLGSPFPGMPVKSLHSAIQDNESPSAGILNAASTSTLR